MTIVAYPDVDTTGENPRNLVLRESHLLTEINDRSKRTLVFNHSPFYRNNFLLEHRDVEGNYSELHEGVDFDFSLRHIAASVALGKDLFGGVTVHTNLISGTVVATYQTLGGKWVGDRSIVLENLASSIFNPRVGSWDQVTNVQEVFPPSPHTQPVETLKGWEDMLAMFNVLINKLGQPVEPSLLYQEQTLRMLQAYDGLLRRVESLEDDVRRLSR